MINQTNLIIFKNHDFRIRNFQKWWLHFLYQMPPKNYKYKLLHLQSNEFINFLLLSWSKNLNFEIPTNIISFNRCSFCFYSHIFVFVFGFCHCLWGSNLKTLGKQAEYHVQIVHRNLLSKAMIIAMIQYFSSPTF